MKICLCWLFDGIAVSKIPIRSAVPAWTALPRQKLSGAGEIRLELLAVMGRGLALAMLTLCLWTAMPRAAALQASAQDGAALHITQRARSLQPGEVVVLEVATSPGPSLSSAGNGSSHTAAIESVQAVAFGRQIEGYSRSHGVWEVLLGIDLGTDPGTYPVEITATVAGSDGGRTRAATASADSVSPREVRARYDLEVKDKQFPTRRLKVAPKYVDPPPETRDRIARESRLLTGLFQTSTSEKLWSGAFTAPVPGRVNPDSFGKRSVFNGKPRSPHSGADFSAPQGTPVKAPNSGTVVLARDLYFAGHTVIIDHGLGLYTFFAHLSKFEVEEGQMVKRGDVLGLSGSTGRVTGPHLHYSVRLNNSRVDPLALMDIAR
ncbi:MAG TPA: M23 family metallopeptidase [Acidobacteriota bacterium]|nr:M23 family metallopeptidase [Acidobacteriota bacterium]